MGFDQSLQHRPVFRALGLFCFDEIRQGEQVRLAFVEGYRGPSFPEFRERIDAAHHCHDIDTQTFNTKGLTTEMDCQATMKVGFLKCWNGNDFSLKFG